MAEVAFGVVGGLLIAANIAVGFVVAKYTFDFWKWSSSEDATADAAHETKMFAKDKPQLFYRKYMDERSRFVLLATGIMTFYNSAITRPLRLLSVIFEFRPFPYPEKVVFIIGSSLFAVMGSFLVTLAWRRFVRYKYYVELKNASWTSLLDPLGTSHTTTPRAAGVPSPRFAEDHLDPTHTEVMKQMTDLGGKRKTTRLELPYSFWIKYKAVLTSEKGVIATSALFGVFAMVAVFAAHGNYKLVRMLLTLLMPVYAIGAFLLIFQVPECEERIKLELSICTGVYFAAFIGGLVSTSMFSQWLKINTVVINTILVVAWAVIPGVMLRVVPAIFAKKQAEEELSVVPLSPRSRRTKLFTDGMLQTLNDALRFSKFMAHCCNEFCAENLLALLEIREFKKMLRKMMMSSSERTSPRPSPRMSPRMGSVKRMWKSRKGAGNSQTKSGSEPPPIEEKMSGSGQPPIEEKMSDNDDEPILGAVSGSGPHLTLTLVDDAHSSDENARAVSEEPSPSYIQMSETSTSGDSAFKKPMAGKLATRFRGFSEPRVHTTDKLEHNHSVFTQAVQQGHFDEIKIGAVGLEASEWDIHWRLSLRHLGVRSAIVSHKDLDWFQKAQALFAKYVAVDSPLQLNVGFKVRDTLELLVGPQSTVGDKLKTVHLLYMFDDVIASVLTNVFDSYHRFERKNAK